MAEQADKETVDRLIFVYKANTGKLNAAIDSAKKLLMINGCALCSITHGLTGAKGEWTECQEEIGVPVDYLHLDELDDRIRAAAGEQYPAVLAEAGGELKLVLTPDVLDRCKGSVNDFKARLHYHAARHFLEIPGLSPLGT